ncbi:MAG: YraN family protein [Clostridia bacterium]|nr:YraN family protein [Clostridia bacterium]
MNKREVWVKGEALARRALEAKGYKILCANYATKIGEIDLIARQEDVIVFVEVKARTSAEHGEPIEAVTARKVSKIVTVAKQYLLSQGIYDRASVRFDVVECFPGGIVRHTENAFTLNDAAKYHRS